MSLYKLVALCGFLGLSSDWDFLKRDSVHFVSSFDYCWDSLRAWGKDFNQKQQVISKKPSLLMGYSLGGRLALHALLDQPSNWQGAIFISTHYGLSDSSLCAQRVRQDEKWAKCFEKEKWSVVMQKWNQQKVFKNDPVINRLEIFYQRDQLAKQLRKGSLGLQENLKEKIEKIKCPILWITGQLDFSYCELAKGLSFCHPLSRWEVLDQGGHRVLWSHPLVLNQLIDQFINKLKIT